jgi:hypothetical protein
VNPWAIVAALVLLAASHTWAFHQGKASCESKVELTTAKEETSQAKDAGNLQAAEAKNAPKIVEKIKIVREAPDPSGCRDMRMPPDVLRALRMRDDQIRHGTDQP